MSDEADEYIPTPYGFIHPGKSGPGAVVNFENRGMVNPYAEMARKRERRPIVMDEE
jgi:hypothetical protein